jgi:small subunit ribosomal protein S7
MPRRGEVPKRKIVADPKYKDRLVAKLTNTVMLSGEKAIAEGIVYGAFDFIQERQGGSLGGLPQGARQRQAQGGGQEPPRGWCDLPGARRGASRASGVPCHALDGVVLAQPRREEHGRAPAAELYEASQGRGNAVKKKEDTHKMADANKAFAHYRW